MNCIIPDTSAVIIGAISKIIETEDIDYPEIIVPEAVVCELEHQANANRSEGIRGLKELQKLQYQLSVSNKTDTIIYRDTIFKEGIKLDTLIKDNWYSLDINLEYP